MSEPCPACRSIDSPRHMHSTAYGMSCTHLAGSEHFACPTCGHIYSRPDAEARGLVYVFDVDLCAKLREVKP